MLSYWSLYSFLFELSVSPENSPYLLLRNGEFVEPATEFVLKLSLLYTLQRNDLPNADEVPPFRNGQKAVSSQEDFVQEAIVQQHLWTYSLAMDAEHPICPPISNLAIFEPRDALRLLIRIRDKANPNMDDDVVDAVHYLADNLMPPHHRWQLGVILMPKIAQSMTLYEVQHNAAHQLVAAQLQSAVQILRAFFFVQVVHLDLHEANILIQLIGPIAPKTPEGVHATLIDFGQAIFLRKAKHTNILKSELRALETLHKSTSDTFIDLAAEHADGSIRTDKNGISDGAHLVQRVLNTLSQHNARWVVDNIANDLNRCEQVFALLSLYVHGSPSVKRMSFNDVEDHLKQHLFTNLQSTSPASYEQTIPAVNQTSPSSTTLSLRHSPSSFSSPQSPLPLHPELSPATRADRVEQMKGRTRTPSGSSSSSSIDHDGSDKPPAAKRVRWNDHSSPIKGGRKHTARTGGPSWRRRRRRHHHHSHRHH